MISWSFLILVVSQQVMEFPDVNQREVNDLYTVVWLNALIRSQSQGESDVHTYKTPRATFIHQTQSYLT